MRSTLFHLPRELAGYPVFGFGLLLAVWLILSAVVLVVMLRRQGARFDWTNYLLLVVPVALVIWAVLPRICDDQGLPIRGYGVMMLLAVIGGTGLATWRARRVGLPAEVIYSLAFWLFVPGIIGARAFYVIEYWSTQFWPAYSAGGPAALIGAVVNLTQGGLVVYGSLIGAAIGFTLFVWRRRLPVLALGDLIVPSLMLGLAIGRIGCLLNGCCYGHVCHHPWAVTFPAGSPVHMDQAMHGRFPIHGVILGADQQGQVLVTGLGKDSAAGRAGLRVGDRLLRINNTPVLMLRDAQAALIHAGDLHLLLRHPTARDQQRDEPYLNWPLAVDHHADGPIYQPIDGERHASGGLRLDGLTLGDSPERGVVVRSVRPGSAAAARGAEVGSQLIAIQGRAATTLIDAQRLLDQFQKEPWVQVRTAENNVIRWTIDPDLPRSQPVHPTQLYSSINAALLCLLLLAYGPFRRRDGELVALFLTVYPVTRYLLEQIRTDEAAVFGTGLSISQNVSIALLIVAGVLWWWVLRQPVGTRHFDGGKAGTGNAPSGG